MELIKATLQNVRLFTDKTFEFKSNSELSMPNEGGKSTLADAITFVLNGKLYSGTNDTASLKPVQDQTLEVSVELAYLDSKGKITVLRKEFKENWVKTRGTTETTMQGHTTTCYINEKKLTITNYEKELCDLFNVPSTKELTILLNPFYFSQQLSWKERLEYVKQVTGEIKPEDVFKTKPATLEIKDDLEKCDFDVATLHTKYFKNIKDKKEKTKEIDIQIKGFTIDEIVTQEQYDEAENQLSRNNSLITDLRVEKEGIKNPTLEKLKDKKQTAQENLTKSVGADNSELLRKNKNIVEVSDRLKTLRQGKYDARNELTSKVREIQSDIDTKEREVKTILNRIPLKEAEKATMVEEYHEVRDKAFKPKDSIICDNCGHDLSSVANAQALEEFNSNKVASLKRIEKQGTQLKNDIIKLKGDEEQLKNDIAKLKTMLGTELESKTIIENDIAKLNLDIMTNDEKREFTYKSEETAEMEIKLNSIIVSIAEESTKVTDSTSINNEIDKIKEKNVDLQKTISEYQAQENLKARKEKLEKQYQTVSEQLSDAENLDDLLTLYSETYLEILTARAEHYFPEIKFKFIEQNIKEGSWNEVCYVMVQTENGLVPYETVNTANKIKVGVKIANQLAKALSWDSVPMVIDNCEAITRNNRTFETDAQIISLVADDGLSKIIHAEESKQIALEM